MMTNYERRKKYEFQRSGIERIEMMICMPHNSECNIIYMQFLCALNSADKFYAARCEIFVGRTEGKVERKVEEKSSSFECLKSFHFKVSSGWGLYFKI